MGIQTIFKHYSDGDVRLTSYAFYTFWCSSARSENRPVEFINITSTDQISVLSKEQSVAVRLQIREWVDGAISTSPEGLYPVITTCRGEGVSIQCVLTVWLVSGLSCSVLE